MATLSDVIGYADAQAVKTLIDNFETSTEKSIMLKAQKYYEAQNDVVNIDFRKYTTRVKVNETEYSTVEKTNENRSNYKVPNNYLKLIVNQLSDYVLGKGVMYQHEDKAFMQYLTDRLGFEIDETFTNLVTQSRIKGRSWLHIYYTKDGMLDFAVIPATQIIPIYEDDFKKKLHEAIRYYSIPVVEGKETKYRKKVEWWTAQKVTIYQEDNKGNFNVISEIPHWSTINFVADKAVEQPNAWGRVPFLELRADMEATSDLVDIKPHIDAYDLILSELVNQIADVRELLIKVLGYSGQEAGEVMQIFRSTGVVMVDSADGDVDTIKSEIPVEARQAALKQLNDNIYRLSRAVDTNPEKYGTAVAGIAIQMMYRPLDSKADNVILRLQQLAKKFMEFIVEDYNRRFNKSINVNDIKISFNKNTIEDTNAIVESSAKLKGIVSDEAIWERLSFVDPATEKERMMAQNELEMDAFMSSVSEEPQSTNQNMPKEEGEEEESIKGLNGAQTQSLLAVFGQYAEGKLTPGQAINLISVSIGVEKSKAKELLEGLE